MSPNDAPACPKLCSVPEQNAWGVPASDPDRLIKWFIGAVVTAVGVTLLSGFVVEQKWGWLPQAVFVAVLLVAVASTGLLRRERYRTTWARGMALLALAGYVAVVVGGSMTGWPLAVMILSVAYLWDWEQKVTLLPGPIAGAAVPCCALPTSPAGATTSVMARLVAASAFRYVLGTDPSPWRGTASRIPSSASASSKRSA